MADSITLAIDVMSGDNGPQVAIDAAKNYVARHKDVRLILVGREEAISPLVSDFSDKRLSVVHAPDIVTMDEKPSFSLRRKYDSSMAVALGLVRDSVADACVSAGNTGALMMLGRQILGMCPGIERPAICKTIPGLGKGTYVLDLGANVECSAEHLVQFAAMGAVLAESLQNLERARVALLNVGEESIKGNEPVRLAASLLQDNPWPHFIGFVEGGDIFRSRVDVIVCDGFVGNVALKSAESMADIIFKGVTDAFERNWFSRLLGKLVSPYLSRLIQRYSPDNNNGAIFLGLQDVLVKSHGNANSISFENAIDVARQEASMKVPELINERLDLLP